MLTLPLITTASQECSALIGILTVSPDFNKAKGRCWGLYWGEGKPATVSVLWRKSCGHTQALSPSLHFSLCLSCSWADEVAGVEQLPTATPAHHHPYPCPPPSLPTATPAHCPPLPTTTHAQAADHHPSQVSSSGSNGGPQAAHSAWPVIPAAAAASLSMTHTSLYRVLLRCCLACPSLTPWRRRFTTKLRKA